MWGDGNACPDGFKFPSGTIPRISDICTGETSNNGSLTCVGQSGGEGGGFEVGPSVEVGAGEDEVVGHKEGIGVCVGSVRPSGTGDRVGLPVDLG